jgi:hypothetical protein
VDNTLTEMMNNTSGALSLYSAIAEYNIFHVPLRFTVKMNTD